MPRTRKGSDGSLSAAALRRVGGHPVVDFVNTLDFDLGEPETLRSYSDFLGWANAVRLISRNDRSRLGSLAKELPWEAANALRSALRLREALRGLMRAAARKRSPSADDVDRLNRFLRKGPRVELEVTRSGLARRVSGDSKELQQPVQLLARLAADLLMSASYRQIGLCNASGCGWFFIDTSPNRLRRWCSMDACGNRAKAQRHYHRSNEVTESRQSSR